MQTEDMSYVQSIPGLRTLIIGLMISFNTLNSLVSEPVLQVTDTACVLNVLQWNHFSQVCPLVCVQ